MSGSVRQQCCEGRGLLALAVGYGAARSCGARILLAEEAAPQPETSARARTRRHQDQMLQTLLNGLCQGSLYAVAALGFGLIYHTTRHFHLAHGAIATVGGYIALSLVGLTGKASGWMVGPVLLGAGTAGVALELAVYRPLSRRNASSEVVLVASLSLHIFLTSLIALLAGSGVRLLRVGASATTRVGPAVLTDVQLGHVFSGLIVSILFCLVLVFSLTGRKWRCVADDHTLARLQGFDVDRVRVVVFAVGSALAGLAGFLQALDIGADPYGGFQLVLIAATAAIAAGRSHLFAPAVTALSLGVFESFVVAAVSDRWRTALTFLLLLGVLLLRPEGLLAKPIRAEER